MSVTSPPDCSRSAPLRQELTHLQRLLPRLRLGRTCHPAALGGVVQRGEEAAGGDPASPPPQQALEIWGEMGSNL